MLLVYLDASALMKRYSPENGSDMVDELFERLSLSRITSTMLGLLEVISILVRKRNDRRLTSELFSQAMTELRNETLENAEFRSTSITDEIILSSANLVLKHSINASDAIVLCCALNLQQVMEPEGNRLAFWCCDKRLIRAAKVEGITVFDPEAETIERFNDLHTG